MTKQVIALARDAFSGCHPAVLFLYFLGTVGMAATVQHPAYVAAAAAGGLLYYLCLTGRRGLGLLPVCLGLWLLTAGINPLLNSYGRHVLFTVFSRKYTWEALCYGMTLGGILACMLLWFGCSGQVLTSDRFTALFGNLIPSLSLLLVMVLRMIPAFARKGRQILEARSCIGRGISASGSLGGRISGSADALSAMTDWALESGILTADSMRARGYGVGKRRNFQLYRWTRRDTLLLVLLSALYIGVLAGGHMGARFTPRLRLDPLSWGFPLYCVYLLFPSGMHAAEVILWKIWRSGI